MKDKNETPVRWGIIGAGDVCEVKSGPGFYKAPGSALVAITKRDPAAAEDFARRHGVSRWYTDPGALLADPEVDAVYVATPPHLHKRFAIQAMRAGKPVLVEKPMGVSGSDCDAMLEVASETAQRLWVAYYRRALDKFVTIKGTIDEGTIGEPRSVLIEFSRSREHQTHPAGGGNWRVDPAVAGAGIIADMGSHMLDLIDWFLGPITTVSAKAANRAGDYAAEDIVSATFLAGEPRGEGGAVSGAALWDLSGSQDTDRTVIRGSAGSIEYSTFDDAPAQLRRGDAVVDLAHTPAPLHVHQPLIALINEEIRGGAASPSGATGGARTNRVLDALVADYYHRRV